MSTDVAATARLVVFRLDEQRYAVELNQADRVLPMVELASLPHAPTVVAGVFDLHGEVIPAMNVRRRLGRPERSVSVNDQLLVVRSRRRRMALIVDEVEEVESVPTASIASAESVVPGLEHLKGIARVRDMGIIFVQDLDRFLSLEGEEQLEAAMREKRA